MDPILRRLTPNDNVRASRFVEMTAHGMVFGMPEPQTYDAWIAELQRLAAEQDLQWLVAPGSAVHRKAYEQGLSPTEELFALRDMSEWRGCGCGGA